MEIYSRPLNDNSRLMTAIASTGAQKGDMVCVNINLPDYLDITSLLAMKKRMVEACETSGVKLRLLGNTTNLEVEKSVIRLFADRDDIFVTVDWREEHAENAPVDRLPEGFL